MSGGKAWPSWADPVPSTLWPPVRVPGDGIEHQDYCILQSHPQRVVQPLWERGDGPITELSPSASETSTVARASLHSLWFQCPLAPWDLLFCLGSRLSHLFIFDTQLCCTSRSCDAGVSLIVFCGWGAVAGEVIIPF